MQNTESTERVSFSGGLVPLFKRLLNLRGDTDNEGTVELITSGVDFQSANAWTLVFAIFIASVGLNLNSTAVIIGAMLISPLMGPILGIGLSLGTYDITLLKKSARNLTAAVAISVMASMIYFMVSPLSEVQSELLARTRPSFYDVLIAFFGGAAGIIAISRKDRDNNAIPGVAIATALMPPLCTAGFGLATRNFGYFLGAMYLFVINCVFISISTFLVVRYLGFHRARQIGREKQRDLNRWITYVGVAVIIPSFFMAWYLQRESSFKTQANKYIARELRTNRNFVINQEVNYALKDPKIKVTLLGDPLSAEDLTALKDKAVHYNLSPESIVISQSSFSENLEKKIGDKISQAENSTRRLEVKLSRNEFELNHYKDLNVLASQVTSELTIMFPKLSSLDLISKGPEPQEASDTPSDTVNRKRDIRALVQWKTPPSKEDLRKINDLLAKRLNMEKENIFNLKKL